MTDAPTLTDFLLARIAEDEAAARHWAEAMERDETEARGVPAWVAMAGGVVIPARVLAECEAKRRIVEEHVQHVSPKGSPLGCGGCERPTPCPTLRALASVHADHPDCREEWRP